MNAQEVNLDNYIQKVKSIISEFGTDLSSGITTSQVSKNREKYGENKLVEKSKKTLATQIIEQLSDVMIIILIAASILSMFVGEVVDGIVIIMIVVLNAILGITQERKAEGALEALKNMAAPKAKVIRDGKLQVIDGKDVVVGDLVKLETGDYVPADLRLTEVSNLKINESALTGESVSVDKKMEFTDENTALGDRVDCAFMSTIVTYGRGQGVVTGVGMNTQIGKIAGMISEQKDEKTPLQQKLASFGKMLGIIVIVISVIIFALGFIRGKGFVEGFMTAISLAVAAIPEGLPAVVTVVLAMGVSGMVKKNAIMKNLSAVETLGGVTVICSDKTGTLTQNKMTVVKLYDNESEWEVTGTGYTFDGEIVSETDKSIDNINLLLTSAVLCNDSKIKDDDVIGDPTEGSLVVLGEKGKINQDEINKQYVRVGEFPFDSDRKLMTTKHQNGDDYFVFTKGATESVIGSCSKIMINGKVRAINEEDKQRILAKNVSYAKDALRVLAFAYKKVDASSDPLKEENELILLGLACMIDPPREEVKDAIKLCKRAGIRPVMITGDNIVTATAIAKDLGIIDSEEQTLESKYIDDYSDDEFAKKVKTTSVFARVSPEHKVRIVSAIKSNGDVAAMTGDGVNDAPALKRADIGIAMGITGTDVSKEAADMILTDDNFTSIVSAVEQGRVIYSNIRKFVGFLLSCNIGEVLIIFVAMLIGWETPLVPIQLLWINLITDSFPAFALGLEEGEGDIMNEKPRDTKEPIVDRKMKIAIFFQSIGLAVAVLASYRLGIVIGQAKNMADPLLIGRTFSFITIICGEMFRAYSARSEVKSVFGIKILSNKFLNYSVLIAIVLLLLVVYVPFLQPIFTTYPLSIGHLFIAFALSLVPLVFGEIAKKVK